MSVKGLYIDLEGEIGLTAFMHLSPRVAKSVLQSFDDMKYSFFLPYAQAVNDDKISLSDILPDITVPSLCKSGRDIVFVVPFPSGERINKGDTLVEIIFYRTDNSYNGHYLDDEIARYPILCEYSGYIYHQFTSLNHSIDDLSKPIVIYSNVDEFIDELYPIKYHIKQDEFTAIKSISWNVNGSDYEDSFLSKYVLNPGTYIDLNVEKNLPVMILGFSRRKMRVYKRDTISFKFEDDTILHFPVLAAPTNNGSQSTVSVALTVNDIEKFETVSWKKIRIEHFNGDAPIIIENECMPHHSEGFAQAFFKKYVFKYRRALDELGIALNAVPKRLVHGNGDLSQSDDACYVYLMIDNTNGYHKIGISIHPDYREKTLQSEKPAIKKICAKRFPSRIIAQSIESALHTAFASKRIRGEWFNLSEKEVAQIVETLR